MTLRVIKIKLSDALMIKMQFNAVLDNLPTMDHDQNITTTLGRDFKDIENLKKRLF